MAIFLFDMGLPMIMPSMVLMVVALLPIIFLEACVVGTSLQMKTKKVLPSIAIANLGSTLIGIPVTWFLLMLLEFVSVDALATVTDGPVWTDLFSVTLGAPWVAPGHNNEKWIILGAMLFLLLPFGIASWGIEYLVVRKAIFKKEENKSRTDSSHENLQIDVSLSQLRRAVGKANLASYCLLAVFVILVFAISLLVSS